MACICVCKRPIDCGEVLCPICADTADLQSKERLENLMYDEVIDADD